MMESLPIYSLNLSYYKHYFIVIWMSYKDMFTPCFRNAECFRYGGADNKSVPFVSLLLLGATEFSSKKSLPRHTVIAYSEVQTMSRLVTLVMLSLLVPVSFAAKITPMKIPSTRLLKEADLSVGEYVGIAVACAVPFLILLFICIFCINQGFASCCSRGEEDIQNLPVAQVQTSGTIASPPRNEEQIAKAMV